MGTKPNKKLMEYLSVYYPPITNQSCKQKAKKRFKSNQKKKQKKKLSNYTHKFNDLETFLGHVLFKFAI